MNIESRLERLEQQLEQLQQSETNGHYYDPASNVGVIKAGRVLIVMPNNRRDPSVLNWPPPPIELAERITRIKAHKETQENET